VSWAVISLAFFVLLIFSAALLLHRYFEFPARKWLRTLAQAQDPSTLARCVLRAAIPAAPFAVAAWIAWMPQPLMQFVQSTGSAAFAGYEAACGAAHEWGVLRRNACRFIDRVRDIAKRRDSLNLSR
jgi:hypothetical protein